MSAIIPSYQAPTHLDPLIPQIYTLCQQNITIQKIIMHTIALFKEIDQRKAEDPLNEGLITQLDDYKNLMLTQRETLLKCTNALEELEETYHRKNENNMDFQLWLYERKLHQSSSIDQT